MIRFLFFLFFSQWIFAQKNTLSGYIKEAKTGEALMGVIISVPSLQSGTTSNENGFYSLQINADSVEIIWSHIGYHPIKTKIGIKTDLKLDQELIPIVFDEIVVVSPEKYQESNKAQIGNFSIPIENVRNTPAILGEKDVLKIIQLMPGVQKGSEGNAGLYVRGGGPDQNLIKVDNATLYNPFHVFGFLSLFNISTVKSIELMKGNFPSRYGGRLSSVVEIRLKDGNKETVAGEVGLGLLATRFSLEGPIKKGKSSWIISGRRSYIDAFTRPLLPKDRTASFYFYDVNAKVSFDLSPKDKLFVSVYNGGDNFFYNNVENWQNKTLQSRSSVSTANIDWGNTFVSSGWSHEFSKNLISNLSLVYTQYKFTADATNGNDSIAYNNLYSSSIKDYAASFDLEYFATNKHKLRFGIQSTFHIFSPEAILVNVQNYRFRLPEEPIQALESGIYVEDEWKISSRLKVNYGVRLAHFYVQNTHYLYPEPRLTGVFKLKNDLAIKAGFSVVNQFMHLLQSTSSNLPTDVWIPADNKIPPQRAYMGSIGIVKDFLPHKFFISLEGFYKVMKDIQGYKEGNAIRIINGSLALDENLTEFRLSNRVTKGNGLSYGAEFLVQKKEGKLTGWIGYTLSWTIFQFPDVNFGQPFYAKYDRRHDLSVVGNYAITPKITLSATWVYATGNRITLPIGTYNSPNSTYTTLIYSGKNEIIVKPYHRLDIGIQFHKKKKKNRERIWEFSIYNVYNNANTFFLFTTTNNDRINVLKEVSSLPIIPSINYTYKF